MRVYYLGVHFYTESKLLEFLEILGALFLFHFLLIILYLAITNYLCSIIDGNLHDDLQFSFLLSFSSNFGLILSAWTGERVFLFLSRYIVCLLMF